MSYPHLPTPSQPNLLVSIIIPCRNEEKHIGKCLDSILANDYPREKIEILAIDGISEDRTKAILSHYAQRYPFLRILENPKRHFTAAVNLGVDHARGDLIMIIGSHATYAPDYISKCAKHLETEHADNVGGVLITSPSGKNLIARSIALSLSHPFGAGNSRFRIGSTQPRWVDTVFGGCYRKETFIRIGKLNENLARSADIEFNRRLRKSGGKILLVPDIIAFYSPQSSLIKFIAHTFDDGYWVSYPLKFGIRIFSGRHLVPPLFVLSLAALTLLSFFSPIFSWSLLMLVSLYTLTSITVSIQISIRNRNLGYLAILPWLFATRHLAYGSGFWSGMIKLLAARQFWNNHLSPRKNGLPKP